MESVLMQLQAMRIDAHRQCNECYKSKVQLKIQLEENDERLQYFRGAIAALDRMEKVIFEQQNPATIPSEHQAMDKPQNINFPEMRPA